MTLSKISLLVVGDAIGRSILEEFLLAIDLSTVLSRRQHAIGAAPQPQ
jgi:hypothetical protein